MKKLLIINIIPSGIGGIQTYGKALEQKLIENGIMVKRIETHKVNIIKPFPFEVFYKTFCIFKNIIILFTIIIRGRKERKIIIHAHVARFLSFWENSIYALFGKIFRIPYIFHIHSSLLHEEYLKSNFFEKQIRKNILNKSFKIIALSDFWKEKLRTMNGVRKDKFVTINNFIDIDKYKNINQLECKRKLNLPFDKKILFSIGRLTERKGYQYLLDSVLTISKNRDDFLVIIGGKGNYKENIENKILNLKIEKYVKLIGYIPDEIFPIWLNAADFFILPSLRETFPIVVLEALASGKPVIGTKIAALPEIICSNNYGLLAEPGNSNDLTEKILMAFEIEWDQNNIKKYAEIFSWNNIEKKLLDIYKEA